MQEKKKFGSPVKPSGAYKSQFLVLNFEFLVDSTLSTHNSKLDMSMGEVVAAGFKI